MSTFSQAAKMNMNVTETLSGDDLGAGQQPILHTGYDLNVTLNSGSTPDVTKASFEDITLTSGAATIDLTAVHLNGAAVTLTALKPATALFRNDSTHDMTIAIGASNGYTGFGAAFSLLIKANGGVAMVYFPAGGVTIDSSHKTLDITGTGTDVLKVAFTAGT